MSMKKKENITVRYINEPVFKADITLVISKWEDFIKEIKNILVADKFKELEEMIKEKNKDTGKWYLATQFPFPGGGSVIWANENIDTGTLVHELVHTAHHLLDTRSVPLSEDTEEVYAYLIEFLFNGLVGVPLKK